MIDIVPAILPSSREDLERKLSLVASFEGVRRVQIDIVDGRFAFPATWPYLSPDPEGELRRLGRLPFADTLEYEIDCMTLDASRIAEPLVACGARRLTLHVEALSDPVRTLQNVRDARGGTESFDIGLALNIGSPLARLAPVLTDIRYVQFMGIARIGVQGQPFERRVLSRIAELRALHPHMHIQVDGGVSFANAHELSVAGVDSLIVGSAIFSAADPANAVKKLQALV